MQHFIPGQECHAVYATGQDTRVDACPSITPKGLRRRSPHQFDLSQPPRAPPISWRFIRSARFGATRNSGGAPAPISEAVMKSPRAPGHEHNRENQDSRKCLRYRGVTLVHGMHLTVF
jgi:hypothetical protein